MDTYEADDVYVFPTSFAQQRLWFTDQLDPGSPAYNVPLAVRIEGPLQVAALTQSIHAIVERHEILRTTFAVMDGEPVQVIHPECTVEVIQVNLDDSPQDARLAYAKELAVAEAQHPFDLTAGPLLRVRLLRLNADDHVLVITMHHIICDGWAMGIFINEMTQLYGAYIYSQTQQRPALPELPIQYADFAEWQRDYLAGDRMAELIAFWKGQLGDDLPVLQLPTDGSGNGAQNQQGARLQRRFAKPLSNALKQLAKDEQTTLYMTLLAAFNLLLHHEAQQDDIVVGTDVANRNRREIEGLIGLFVNQLVLRTDLSGDPTFGELVQKVRQTVIDASDHQDLPFDKLVEVLNPKRTSSNSPLFQAKFVFQNTPEATSDTLPASLGLTLTPLTIMKETARFDLLWTMRELPEGLMATAEFRTDLYSTAYVEGLFDRFDLLLQSIVEQPNSRLSELCKPLVEAEKAQQQLQQQAYKDARKRSRRRINPKEVAVRAIAT